jgi:cytochrome bd ubiquinol oxidase subunit II
MFEKLSLLSLQQYWWIIIAILGAMFVFLTFVQGGQSLIYSIGKTESEKTLLINVLGRKWEFTFTTLVTFGGAFFASFPLYYATSFGGAYWVWIAILFAFVLQAVSYEFRKKPGNLLGARTFEIFLIANGFLGTILIGTAVGTFFNGAQFSLNEMRQVQWQSPFRGLEAIATLHNVALGLTIFFLSRVLGSLYFIMNVGHKAIVERSRKQLLYNAIPFLVFFLWFVIELLLKPGFAVRPETSEVYMENFKYFHNLVQMPLNAILFVAGVASVLWGIGATLFQKSNKGFYFTGAGTVLVVFALFILAGFNNTAFYPSVYDLQSSLTIRNASSSHFTLVAMSYVSLLIPFVLVYITYFWRAMNKKKIDEKELGEESHLY